MSDLADLIARIEAASEGGDELDRAIRDYLFPSKLDPDVALPEGFGKGLPAHFGEFLTRYTRSLDAALSLVPEGDWTKDIAICPEMGSVARVYPGPIRENSAGEATGYATTPALALVIAALKARSAA